MRLSTLSLHPGFVFPWPFGHAGGIHDVYDCEVDGPLPTSAPANVSNRSFAEAETASIYSPGKTHCTSRIQVLIALLSYVWQAGCSTTPRILAPRELADILVIDVFPATPARAQRALRLQLLVALWPSARECFPLAWARTSRPGGDGSLAFLPAGSLRPCARHTPRAAAMGELPTRVDGVGPAKGIWLLVAFALWIGVCFCSHGPTSEAGRFRPVLRAA